MTNIVKDLKVKCAEAGTNLSEVCRESGIPRTTVEGWKRKIPKPIESLIKLEATIKRKKEEKETQES